MPSLSIFAVIIVVQAPVVMIDGEDMFELLFPIADKWRVFGEKLGCNEDLIDEIFTNNETDRECLHHLCDIYRKGRSRDSVIHALQEIGETDLAEKCLYPERQGTMEWYTHDCI